jgi:hypothetical protein
MATATRARKTTTAKEDTTPVDHNEGTTSDEVKKTYLSTATGRGGKSNTRKTPTACLFAVDVADDKAKTEAGRAGLIFRFFAAEAKAIAFAEKKNSEGYDAIVTPATSKEA